MEDEQWSTSANEAINIRLLQVDRDEPKEIASFHPEYTEQQFGKDQSIFGYKDLSIDLSFAAHDLRPHFSFKHGEKWKTLKDAKAVDVQAIFEEHLSSDAFEGQASFDRHLKDTTDAAEFRPPGQRNTEYTKDGRNYEIYSGELTNFDIRKIIERIQILIPFFIDGGLPIPTDDPEWSLARWKIWLIYEKLSATTSPYSFVGYCTSYRFLPYRITDKTSGTNSRTSTLTLPITSPISLSDLPNRSRISQFLILPHHQGQSHGRRLYETVMKTFIDDPACIEMTVEDPNEDFDDLRDLCDYARLISNGTLAQVKLNIDLDPKLTARRPKATVPTNKLLNTPLLEQLRNKNKLAPKQWRRLIEIYLLSQIPTYSREAGTARLIRKAASSDKGDKALYYWRLLVKQRIYKQNKDVLKELEQEERVEKLEETLNTQWMDYERILQKIKDGESNEPRPMAARAKRRIVEEESDDDDEISSQASKRAKV